MVKNQTEMLTVLVQANASSDQSDCSQQSLSYEHLSVARSRLTNSKLISNLLEMMTVDIVPLTNFPRRAVDHYLSYTVDGNITDEDLACYLRFCHAIEDPIYFQHLLSLLHQRWWTISVAEMFQTLHEDLKYEISLHTPLQLLPDIMWYDDNFIGAWLTINQDKTFTIEGKLYSCRVETFASSGKLASLDLLVDGRLHGPYFQWYDNGSRHWFKNYSHGLENGLVIEYYPNQINSYRNLGYYVQGVKIDHQDL